MIESEPTKDNIERLDCMAGLPATQEMLLNFTDLCQALAAVEREFQRNAPEKYTAMLPWVLSVRNSSCFHVDWYHVQLAALKELCRRYSYKVNDEKEHSIFAGVLAVNVQKKWIEITYDG